MEVSLWRTRQRRLWARGRRSCCHARDRSIRHTVAMRTVTLPDRTTHAAGTRPRHLAHGRSGAAQRASEVAAVRLAFELGYRLIDTAEMYGEGGAEQVVGEALAEALRGRHCAARRGVRRQQGLPAQRQPRRRRRRLRPQPQASGARPDRPIPAALARARTRCAETVAGVRGAARARDTSATGASATSTSTTWIGSLPRRAALPAPRTRSTTRSASAAPSSRCCRGSANARCR